MNKIILITVLSYICSPNLYAASNLETSLNTQIRDILSPLQSKSTKAQVNVEGLELNFEHATKLSLTANYRKVTPQHTLEVLVTNFNYEYGNGLAPTTQVNGTVGLNATKLFTQDKINFLIPLAESMLDGMVKSYSQQYGEASAFKGTITSTQKDQEGNYTAFTAYLSLKFNLNQLPLTVKKEDIPISFTEIKCDVNLKTGMRVDAVIVSNPGFWRFHPSEEGLKEMVELLLNKDKVLKDKIQMNAIKLDRVVGQALESNPSTSSLG